jgi:hypothetical protein
MGPLTRSRITLEDNIKMDLTNVRLQYEGVDWNILA